MFLRDGLIPFLLTGVNTHDQRQGVALSFDYH